MENKNVEKKKMYSGTSNVGVGLDKAVMETMSHKRAKFVSLCFLWLEFVGKGDNILYSGREHVL